MIASARCSPSTPLTLVAQVEKLLQQLRQCRASFNVIFFEGYTPAWQMSCAAAAASREVLKMHLACLPDLRVSASLTFTDDNTLEDVLDFVVLVRRACMLC